MENNKEESLFGTFNLSDDSLIEVGPTGEVIPEGTPKGEDETDKPDTVIDTGKLEVSPTGEVTGEVKTEESQTGVEDEPSSTSTLSSPSDPLKLFASVLQEEGVITTDADKLEGLNGPSDLVGLIQETIKQNEFADLPPEVKLMVEDYRQGVPSEVLREYNNQKLRLDNLDDARFLPADEDDDEQTSMKEQARQTIIEKSFVATGMNQERATKLAKRSVELGDDIEDVKQALVDLRAVNERFMETERQNAQASKQKLQDDLNSIEKKILKTEEILPGMTVPEKTRKMLFDQMTRPIASTEQGPVYAAQQVREKDPIAFDLKLHYLISLGVFDDNPDLSVFGRTKRSKKVDDFTKSLGSSKSTSFGGGSSTPRIHSNVDDTLLKSLDNL